MLFRCYESAQANPPGAELITRRKHPKSQLDLLLIFKDSWHLLPQLTLVGTRSPDPHLNSWVDQSNVSEVSCSRNQQQLDITSHNLSITRSRLAMLHTHTHMHTNTLHTSQTTHCAVDTGQVTLSHHPCSFECHDHKCKQCHQLAHTGQLGQTLRWSCQHHCVPVML